MTEQESADGEAEQRRLAEAARRYRDFTEISRDWYWEMNAQLQFTYFSKEFEEATGLALSDILGKTRWEGLGAKQYGEVDWDGHIRTLMAHQPYHGFEYPSQRVPGRTVWFRSSGKPRLDAEGKFVGYFGIASDVTAFKNIEENLRKTNEKQKILIEELEHTKDELTQSIAAARRSQSALETAHKHLEQKHRELQALSEEFRRISITDPLTGAYNRRFFLESTATMTSYADRHKVPLSLILIDLDHFKKINDAYGHLVGDKVLQLLTSVCKAELRDEDVFARFGGEEFVIALPGTDGGSASLVAERLRARFSEQRIAGAEGTFAVTLSAGVAQYQPGQQKFDEALARADEALYQAKSNGRNCVARK